MEDQTTTPPSPVGQRQKPVTIALIGVGQVGSATAHALLSSPSSPIAHSISTLLLIDHNIELRNAQVHDLADAACVRNTPIRIRAASYHEAGQEADIIIITAGSRHTWGQSNFELRSRNVSVVRNILAACAPFRRNAILIVASQPVDLLTSLALEGSRLPASQVFGVGTFLDSARLRAVLADKIGIAPSSIDVHAVGVQGGDEVVAWSCATVGGVPIDKSGESIELLGKGSVGVKREALVQECRAREEEVVRQKGAASPLGMGTAIASLCSSILLDRRNVRVVSHFQEEFRCCFSSLVVLGKRGIVQTIEMPLSEEEKGKVAESARRVKALLDRIHEQQHA